MVNSNSQNPGKGKSFQMAVQTALESHFGMKFQLEKPFAIGNPAKDHKFDIVSVDGTIIAETKNYSWTETGNIPSAKMAFLNEAIFYLQHTPKNATKILVMRLDKHPRRNETLAEYYVRTYRHLFEDVKIMEYDVNLNKLIVLTN